MARRKVDVMMKAIATVLLLGTMTLWAGPVRADSDGHSLEQLVVEMATTPGQHAALGRHFRAKAEEARAGRERHERMARTYSGGKHVQRSRMKQHCQKISDQYDAMAQEYDSLAELHEAEAKKQ